MSKALANELAAVNIRVNTVHPTGVETGMQPASLHTLLVEKRPDLGPIFPNALPHRDGRGRSTSATRCCSWSPTSPAT